jgi:hypothetical protein
MVRLNNKVMLLLCSAMTFQATRTEVVIQGGTGVTTGQTSNTAIVSRALHKKSGTIFYGATATGSSANSVMYVGRPVTTDVAPTATGIAADSTIRNTTINNLAVIESPTTPADVTQAKVVVTSGGTPTALYLITTTAGTAVAKTMIDANRTGSTTGKIMAIAGGNTANSVSLVFAAVKKNGATTNFAASNTGDGIASILINNTTLAMTPAVASVNTTTPLDTVITHSLSFGHPGTEAVATGNPCMTYDADLNRLYVGIGTITTNNTTSKKASGAAYSIAIFKPSTTTGALTQLSPTGANNPVTPLGTTSKKYVIGQYGANKALSVANIKVMTTSTGPSTANRFKYLIVNGGNGSTAATGNQVWALPLVVGNATDNNNGTFAAVTRADFGAPASAEGDLYLTTSNAAKVGNGPLPMPISSAIADMHVDGDAVYVSISGAASTTQNPGLYVSQAIFDNLGKIAAWTEWHKITPNAAGNSEAAGRTGLFTVDAVTGHITVVDPADGLKARVTQWQNQSFDAATGAANAKGLITNLNTTANVGDGCTAVCDLNSTTTAWGNVTNARMALFGGVNGKVCFAMTGSAVQRVASNALTTAVVSNTGCEMIFDTSSSTVSLDYTSSNTLLLTTLPTGAGTVRALSHSGWYPNQTTTPSFFFAGAETGDGNGALYAYCTASLGAGANQSTFKNFGVAPFRAFSWQKLDRCDGIPVKIEAKGGGVYILTRKVDASGTPTDRIFRLTQKSTGALLNTNFIVTATAGETNGNVNLSAVKHIYDFAVSQVGAGTEQLTMLTNDGIYTTTSSAGCDAAGYNNNPALAMLNCGWVKVTSPATAEDFMLKIFSQSHTRTPQTFTAAAWQANTNNDGVYDQVVLGQYGRATTGTNSFGQDSLPNFNGYSTTTLPGGLLQIPVVTNYYSDGAVRLLSSVARTTSSHAMKLASIPYRDDDWNTVAPYTINDAAVKNLGAVYWASPIAGTMMIGTSKGVVARQ